MWLDGLLLLLTLTVALIGTTTEASKTATGKIVLCVLLVFSTGLSVALKRSEARRARDVQRRLEWLTHASLPSDKIVDMVKRVVAEVRLEEGFPSTHTARSIRRDDLVYVCWLFHDDGGEELESLTGFLALDHEDLEQLALLETRELRRAIRELVVGSWRSDDVGADEEVISSRIIKTIEGWLLQLDEELPMTGYSSTKRTSARGQLESLSLVPLDEDDRPLDGQSLEFSKEDLQSLLALPVLPRGARIAQLADAWVRQLERSLGESNKPQEPHAGASGDGGM